MLNCITKTVEGNALKNSERKDRHAPYCTRVPYLSKSIYVGGVTWLLFLYTDFKMVGK